MTLCCITAHQYQALEQLTQEGQWTGQQKGRQDEMLEIMFKKYPTKTN